MADFQNGFRTYEEGRNRKLGIPNDRAMGRVAYHSSTSYDYEYKPPPPSRATKPQKATATTSSSPSSKCSAWGFSDPEMKRRKRVACYKAYAVEGKVKASFRKGFRWIKDRCSDLVHGY